MMKGLLTGLAIGFGVASAIALLVGWITINEIGDEVAQVMRDIS